MRIHIVIEHVYPSKNNADVVSNLQNEIKNLWETHYVLRTQIRKLTEKLYPNSLEFTVTSDSEDT